MKFLPISKTFSDSEFKRECIYVARHLTANLVAMKSLYHRFNKLQI